MTYERILVPLDGSQLAEYVLPHAWSLAGAYSSFVTLFHVVEPEDSEHSSPSQKAARADVSDYLSRAAETLDQRGVKAEWRVAFGDPADEIVRYAIAGEYDLVVMSTHGEGGPPGDGTGSVAIAVVSSGAVPVMIVKPPEEIARR
jgi:nucleotide-binding universal stress UspA family protein